MALGFAIPIALIPLVLVLFTQRRRIMGTLTNSRVASGLARLVGALIVGLDLYLLAQNLGGGL